MPSMSIIFLFLCILSIAKTAQQQKQPSHTNFTSSLSPSQPLTSPSGLFAFGFYKEGTGYAVGIWLNTTPSTVVWTANRDDPPVSANSNITLKDGKLVLSTEQGKEKLVACNDTCAVSFASLYDSGNLVLCNKNHEKIWESFEYPTDSILGGQTLFPGGELISSKTESNHSTGQYRLKMQDDGNLVLYPMNTTDTGNDAYWASDTFGTGPNSLLLNTTGLLQIINKASMRIYSSELDPDGYSSSDDFTSDGNSTVYRATLDVDGFFRLYSHQYNRSSGEFKKITKWAALTDPCDVKSFCGFNSYCTLNDNEPYCRCIPGSAFIDPNQTSLGCSKTYSEGCVGKIGNALRYNISTMKDMSWGDHPYTEESMSEEECSKSCLEDCNCGAALFSDHTCKKIELPLRYVRRLQRQKASITAFFKVGKENIPDRNRTDFTPKVVIRSKKEVKEVLLVTFTLVLISFLAIIASGCFIYKSRILRYKRLLESGNDDLTEDLTLRLFTYKELKVATNGFKQELGKGSFGAVYKGSLCKGKKLVAVKRLEKLVEEGEREFQAEMRAIGRTHHNNLVRLLGYCSMDSKRLLVYEYMSNGSLADLLFKSSRRPNWNERARIAVDVARGILYLHEECEAPIIHCDIKPQNILMGDFWTAKISDFGLAKLLMPDQTRTFTIVRGTRGYLAPEWHKNIPITVKADVYSYGIVLLEIVCCRKNMELNVSEPEQILLSTWVYNCFAAGELYKIVSGAEASNTKIFETMVKVALWCIQDEPALRPSMKSVVLMLEGVIDIPIPPCPTNTSIYPIS